MTFQINEQQDYHALNAMLNLYDSEGNIRFDKDKLAIHHYFHQHVNQNTVFFHDLKEKLDFLQQKGYYETEVLKQYDFTFIKKLFQQAYSKKISLSNFFWAHSNITPAIH